jgi:hypothetical protein
VRWHARKRMSESRPDAITSCFGTCPGYMPSVGEQHRELSRRRHPLERTAVVYKQGPFAAVTRPQSFGPARKRSQRFWAARLPGLPSARGAVAPGLTQAVVATTPDHGSGR